MSCYEIKRINCVLCRNIEDQLRGSIVCVCVVEMKVGAISQICGKVLKTV